MERRLNPALLLPLCPSPFIRKMKCFFINTYYLFLAAVHIHRELHGAPLQQLHLREQGHVKCAQVHGALPAGGAL